jgi:hypothetical protein
MRILSKILGAAASVVVLTGTASADTAVLPTFGHYIGYGQVMSVTTHGVGTCTQKVGDTYMGQLELDTPGGQLVQKFRTVVNTSSGPVVYKERFFNTGTKKNQVGTVEVELEEIGAASRQTYNYSATATPLDLNSFSILLTTELTNTSGTPTCTETDSLVFVRSSAD